LSHHALLSGKREQLWNIQSSQTLNVDRSAHLVSLVVELGVDFGYLILLGELPGRGDLIDSLLYAPVDEVSPHLLNVHKNEFPTAAKPQVVVIIKTFVYVVASGLNPPSERIECLLLLLGDIAHKSSVDSCFWFGRPHIFN